MKLLAIDTSTESCSVAVSLDGGIRERFELGMRHSELVLALVEQMLAESGVALRALDAIAFGRGPGSFTSLRIGAGVVQGLAFGAGLPVVPVSSLAVLAQGAGSDRVLAAFDARMGQVYWGAFVRDATGLVTAAGAEIVSDPPHVPLPEDGGWIGAGSGWDACHEALAARLGGALKAWRAGLHPHAREVAVLGAAAFAAGTALAPEDAVPVYIRDEVAAKPQKR
jgi:tRNA threonylcarbamoyladenosine biosynthesis protein TsaB